MGCLPVVKDLLDWAERSGKIPLTEEAVRNLAPHMEEDPMVVNHLLWAFFQSNLVGAAKEIFDNVSEFQGLEVWRRLCDKINVFGENRRDELYEKVRHPRGTNKFEEVGRVIEEWDTSQRLFVMAGGSLLPDDDRSRILRRIVPVQIRDQLILQMGSHQTWESLKNYVLEKARLLASSAEGKQLHLAVPVSDCGEEEAISLQDEIADLGPQPSTEAILAIVARRATGRFVPRRSTVPGARRDDQKPGPQRTGDRKPEDRKPPVDKNGDVRCANCGAKGHTKDVCRKAVVKLADRPCFICNKTGHIAARCPMRSDANAKLVENDAEEAIELQMMELESPWSDMIGENSFQVLIEFDSESEPEEDDEIESEFIPQDVAAVPCCRWKCVVRGRRCIENIREELYDMLELPLANPHAREAAMGEDANGGRARDDMLLTLDQNVVCHDCDVCSTVYNMLHAEVLEWVEEAQKVQWELVDDDNYDMSHAEVLEWVEDAQEVQWDLLDDVDHQPSAAPVVLHNRGILVRHCSSFEEFYSKLEEFYLNPLRVPLMSSLDHSCSDEESIEDSVGAACADPWPTNLDVACAFLDAEDVELNVHEADSNVEFLESNFEVALDSGAGDHVSSGAEAPAFAVEESPGSRARQHFLGAGGHRMPNQGQMKLDLRAENGKRGRDLKVIFQVAKVIRPLMSVSKICDAGLAVKFTKDLALVIDAKDNEVCRFQRRGGLYVASMKMRNPSFKPEQRFTRPGTK